MEHPDQSGQVDPHEFKYPFATPYNAMFNNPVSIVDPTGMDGEGSDEEKKDEDKKRERQTKLREFADKMKEKADEHEKKAKENLKESVKLESGVGVAVGGSVQVGKVKVEGSVSLASLEASVNGAGKTEVAVVSGAMVGASAGSSSLGAGVGEALVLQDDKTFKSTRFAGFSGIDYAVSDATNVSSDFTVSVGVQAAFGSAEISVDFQKLTMAGAHASASVGFTAVESAARVLVEVENNLMDGK